MKNLPLIVAALVLAGCSKDIQTPEAVRQAVTDDVRARASKTGLNPDAMDVSVSSVSFATDQAHANVAFTPKGMPPGSGMSMDYTLARQGGKWVVTDRQMSGGTPHEAIPPGSAPGSGELPPGHPSLGTKQ